MRDKVKFVTFIITHNRARDIPTILSLENRGFDFSTPWFLVVDDKDPQLENYLWSYSEHVLVFSKLEAMKSIDLMDNFGNMKLSIYAREACYQFANSLGYEYYLMLDDDYTDFRSRVVSGNKLLGLVTQDLGRVFDLYFSFLNTSDDIKVVALSQGGDFVGGIGSGLVKSKLKRKSMNGFFCRASQKLNFCGTMNEDVNSYILDAKTGAIHLTAMDFSLEQAPTQTANNGLTDLYNKYGTYTKSFYSVMCRPDCVKVSVIGSTNKRVHHKIDWARCATKIISDRYKKEKRQ